MGGATIHVIFSFHSTQQAASADYIIEPAIHQKHYRYCDTYPVSVTVNRSQMGAATPPTLLLLPLLLLPAGGPLLPLQKEGSGGGASPIAAITKGGSFRGEDAGWAPAKSNDNGDDKVAALVAEKRDEGEGDGEEAPRLLPPLL